ncbi:transposable element Tc1 transposase [Trichonephila clavipes]|nr:transposable element Tc1 transposase [Trichonephila clavipes]
MLPGEFDIAHSVVSLLWKSFKTTGMCSRRHGEIVLEVRRLQKTDISSYQQKGSGASQLSRWKFSFLLPQKSRSPENCCQTFEGGGLYARRPVVCVPLTRQHRTARLQWCREHHNWTEQDWACVLFSDESRFSLSSDCRRRLIWREIGTAYRPENIQEKGPISSMHYHGVGRHHDQWPHAPTCGCEWDYDGPTIH